MFATEMLVGWFYKAPVLFALVALMVIDVLVGLAAAFVAKNVRSDTARNGMVKKCIVLMLVGTGHILQVAFPQIPWGGVFGLFFCASEAISIMKNAANAGIPLPPKLIDALQEITRTATNTGATSSTIVIPEKRGGANGTENDG